MSKETLQLDIVSAEKEIFSGKALSVSVAGELGELCILPGHSQLMTMLLPGSVHFVLPSGEEEVFYISGGILEVQPSIVSILADTAIRAADMDEAEALAAKAQAEQLLAGRLSSIDLTKAVAELAEISAQVRAIQSLKKRAKGERG